MTAPASTTPFDAIAADFVGALGPGSDFDTLPLSSVEAAFAGRSNVGKSSLLNALLQRKSLVRTSNTPGCTRQINFFEMTARDGVRLCVVDLPGYGFAKRSKSERNEWADLIEGYVTRRSGLRALVLLVDARRGLEEDDLALLDFARKQRGKGLSELAVVVVATKIDKLPSSKAKAQLDAIKRKAGRPVIAFSAVTKAGYRELWEALRRSLGLVPLAPEQTPNPEDPG